MCKNNIAIIGGGASGMLAAIVIKKQLPNAFVTIYECQNRLGKKLLQTGNGKCNLSNKNIKVDDYNSDIVKETLQNCDHEKITKIFNELGLIIKADEEGRIYPYSERATTVLDILMNNIAKLDINVVNDITICDIRALDDFSIYSIDLRLYHADYVVMACGGNSNINYTNLGYEIAKYFGHEITKISPALVALKTKEKTKALSGIRIKASASILIDNDVVNQTNGEILFKNDGLSGIAIFELSRYYDNSRKNVIEIDLMPEVSEEELNKRFDNEEAYETLLLGYFPKMINYDILERLKKEKKTLVQIIKHYCFNIIDTYGFENAQITKGGVDLEDINPFTYESLIVNNLYIIGEMLDIDGRCGGYNLHFAWASSYHAGNDIVNKIKENDNEFTK